MKLTYKQRLFLYFVIIFAAFTAGVVVFEQSREKRYRTEALQEKLDAYAELVNAALMNGDAPDTLLALFPQNIRLSLIDERGNVQFDNSIKDVSMLENHAERPEIAAASDGKTGMDIRTSSSNSRAYLYYAKRFGNRYIRVALPYDIQTQRFLKADNAFLYFIIVLFVVMLLLMNVITDRFGKSIRQLRDFAVNADRDETPPFNFPNDELGEIGIKITENYRLLKQSKKATDSEREKLLQHVHSSEEGICFFSATQQVEFYNGLFIQYLNTLTNEPCSEPSVIFTENIFAAVTQFISENKTDYFDTQIKKYGKTFSMRGNRFDDGSFEIILNDITKQEKTRLLKQEMTGNIAHELRTPVTSIRGYLETVLEQPLSNEQKRHFIMQAFDRTVTLSELIQDMSLITKMEEAPQSFKTEAVNIRQLLETLQSELSVPLQEKNITMQCDVPADTVVQGNKNLLYSIFRNLTDNAIHYAGSNVVVQIRQYSDDGDFFSFSFTDNGAGIPNEQHLPRIFERFYRISEGRTRDTGGSGLGLSIVKNAVAFHKGSITAKNRATGGLEFLFTLRKF
ncbi:MAG: HAMP domain-containing histidine kinase [Cytophagaceae bacterium]|jgi:signal transduction histidine kinase|nr:HAMP domain-containing histidine kinase [Cytophagaceae bacterium]